MKYLRAPLAFAAFVSALSLSAAEKITITVTNDLDIARPAETITLPWSEVQKAMFPERFCRKSQ